MKNTLLRKVLSSFPARDFRGISNVTLTNDGDLPSWFETSDLVVSSIAAAGLMLSRLKDSSQDAIKVDRRLASFWLGMTLRPEGWNLPSIWDPIAGDYQTADGWIRLHTNAPHHRAAALTALGVEEDKGAVKSAVMRWQGIDLETGNGNSGGKRLCGRDA